MCGGGVRIFIRYLPGYSHKAYAMCSRLACMGRRELCKVFPHLKEWCGVLVYGNHPVSMAQVWSWMGGCEAIHTESGEVKCEIAMYRLST